MEASEGLDVTTELDYVCSFYKDDLQPDTLRAQLLTFGIDFKHTGGGGNLKPSIIDIKRYLASLSNGQWSLLSQVCIVLKLILIMPASNATSERSFSALRRVKTYLRNTMSQQRLNNLLVLHVHKDIIDTVNLKSIANDFIKDSEHRHKVFGAFD